MSKGFETCPVCEGDLKTKNVEKLLRGGENTAIVEVEADVCLRCGERLYGQDVVEKFEDIRDRLENGDVEDMKLMGNVYRAA
jgi:YgiT-type zinc finger domain-containing protein